ncbi:MAG: class I SAM-dependent methyltransferase [Thermoplasmata archaeon]|nr:class I SAM-dependent methyltransferase [Thermoplasmata archaeon]
MERTALYEDLAEYYDRIYAGKDYAGEARRLTRLARRYAPAARTLLDVACGTGRHLVEFRKNFRVEGVDVSRSMLAVARRRLGRGVPLTPGDMRTFDLHRRFDVVVCLFSAIGYLTTRADRARTFRNLFRHLAPGGVVLVEGWILPSEYRAGTAHLQTYDGPDVKIARVSLATRRGGLSRIEMDYLIGDPVRGIRHRRETHRNALVEPAEMIATMQQAGFRASVLRTGSYRTRGLYIGRRPKAGRRAA